MDKEMEGWSGERWPRSNWQEGRCETTRIESRLSEWICSVLDLTFWGREYDFEKLWSISKIWDWWEEVILYLRETLYNAPLGRQKVVCTYVCSEPPCSVTTRWEEPPGVGTPHFLNSRLQLWLWMWGFSQVRICCCQWIFAFERKCFFFSHIQTFSCRSSHSSSSHKQSRSIRGTKVSMWWDFSKYTAVAPLRQPGLSKPSYYCTQMEMLQALGGSVLCCVCHMLTHKILTQGPKGKHFEGL